MKNEQIQHVKRSRVCPDPNQPRKVFNPARLKELADSIREVGIQNPLIVRAHPKPNAKDVEYIIIAGERRWRASELAKLDEVPVIVRELNDRQVFNVQMIENQQRENLTLLEEARALADELAKRQNVDPKFSKEDLAKDLGQSRATVYERLKLTRLTAPVEKALTEGKISASVAGLVAIIPLPEKQADLVKQITNENDHRWPYSFRQVEKIVDEEYVRNLNTAPFDQKHPYGKLCLCAGCPHRTGNMGEQFPDLKARPNVCTNTVCFEQKTKAATEITLAEKKAAGQRILPPEQYEKATYDYSPAGERCWRDSKDRTYGQLAKTAGIPPMVTVKNDGTPVEVFSPEDKEKIYKACKIKIGSGFSPSAADKARQKREKEMKATAMAATTFILDKLGRAKPGDKALLPFWVLLAQAAYDTTSIDRHDFAAKRRGLSLSINQSREECQKWLKANKDPRECALFAIELLLCACWGGGWSGKFDRNFQEVCRLVGGSKATPDKLANLQDKIDEKGGFWDTSKKTKPKSSVAKTVEKIAAKTCGKKGRK